MDIIVEGYGEKKYFPNQISLIFNFEIKKNEYEKVMEEGVAKVSDFMKLLEDQKFSKKDVKTKSFKITEKTKYDDATRKYVFESFLYNQTLKLEFDYDMKKMASLMEDISKFDNAPKYSINFQVKSDDEIGKEIIKLAYENAKYQADAVAAACGKTIVDCKKISFEPFDADLSSSTNYGGTESCYSKSSANSTRDQIQNVIVPEDVVIGKEIYCLFIAE